ncbi:MAG: TubC N-terminal docking domain-related protein [Acidithiobacillus ferrivorans]
MKTSNPSPMAASSILAELKAAGFALTAEGSRLRVAPADMLTDELRQRIREHRTALMSILAAESAPAVRSATDATPAACVRPEQDMAHCGACSHFLPDAINPAQGVGRCGVTGAGPPSGGDGYKACYPMAPRQCPSYEGNET